MKLPSFKRLAGITTTLALLVAASPVGATAPGLDRQGVENVKSGRTVSIPANAVQVADGVFSLGSKIDPQSGKLVDGYMVVSHKSTPAKGGHGNSGGSTGGSTCYAFLANGANWKAPEDYMIDPTNIDGLTSDFVRNSVNAATGVWESASGANIFGNEVAYTGDGADISVPDGKNEVTFGNIDSPGVVAVTTVWGIFRGSPNQRQLVEWDQVYDDVDYQFGDAAANPSLIDFASVAAHEVGHGAGMGHPSDSCTLETMYRFVAPGQTFQRDLHDGDIAGIKALY